MALKLSSELEGEIERLVKTAGYSSAEELLRSALIALEAKGSAFWKRIERLDLEADEDVERGRSRPVSDELVAELRALVTRPTA